MSDAARIAELKQRERELLDEIALYERNVAALSHHKRNYIRALALARSDFALVAVELATALARQR
jgi:hypothetical protein